MKQFAPTTAAVFLGLALFLVCLVDLADSQNNRNVTATQRRRGNRGNRRNNANRGANRAQGRPGRRGRGRRPGGRGGNRPNRGGNRGGRRNRLPADCEEIHVPMCKGLIPYTHTKLPNQFNHTTQLEVYRELEHMWAYMDHSCSKNTRVMTCAMYLPKCMRSGPPQGPCKKTCMAAKRKCARPLQEMLGLRWATKFQCRGLPKKKCVKPVKDSVCAYPNPDCVLNSALNVCGNLTIGWVTLPNMFQQCHVNDMNKELEHYNSLIASGCHSGLQFLLCGVYSPFCVMNQNPYTFPCREICDEVRSSCEAEYRRLNHNLPWPSKLQCHRYPLSTDSVYQCVMPDMSTVFGGRAISEGEDTPVESAAGTDQAVAVVSEAEDAPVENAVGTDVAVSVGGSEPEDPPVEQPGGTDVAYSATAV